jgi:hypothetical protein
MINVNQLTQQLRMLPDQALQRMAQMYKQDPYIFPMIISEGMARKKLRMAGQAQAAQPQPKVNDQAVASLGYTPEEVGIAGLAAPNMQGMADGGIAGYDDFAQHSEPVVRMAEGGVARYQTGGSTPFSRSALGQMFGDSLAEAEQLRTTRRLRDELQSTYGPRAGIAGAFMEQSDLDRETAQAISGLLKELSLPQLQALKQYGLSGIRDVIREKRPELFEKLDADARARVKTPAPVKQPLPSQTGLTAESLKNIPTAYETVAAAYGPDAERMPQPSVLAAEQRAATAPGRGAPGVAGVGVAGAPGAAPGAAPAAGGAAAPARPGESDVAKAKRAAGEFFDEGAVKGDVEAYVERVKGNIAEGRTRVEQALKKDGKAYAGLEALLEQEGVDAKKGLEQDKAMAILNAGLAMMAGTSPRALENIGKGAMVGTSEYSSAMKDFKKSAKERQRAMADIEQARRAEARDDTKTMLAFEQSAETRLENAEHFGIKAIMDVTNAKAGAAANIYKGLQDNAAAMQRVQVQEAGAAARQQQELGSRVLLAQAENATRMAIANLPGAEERLIRAFGNDPEFRSSYERFRSIGADQRALQDLLVKIASSPGGMQILKQQDSELYNTLQAYSTKLAGAGIQAVGSVPQGAGVRP